MGTNVIIKRCTNVPGFLQLIRVRLQLQGLFFIANLIFPKMHENQREGTFTGAVALRTNLLIANIILIVNKLTLICK
jgi:hypothetical protein